MRGLPAGRVKVTGAVASRDLCFHDRGYRVRVVHLLPSISAHDFFPTLPPNHQPETTYHLLSFAVIRVGKARESRHEFARPATHGSRIDITYSSCTYEMEDHEDDVVWVHRTRNLNRNTQNCH